MTGQSGLQAVQSAKTEGYKRLSSCCDLARMVQDTRGPVSIGPWPRDRRRDRSGGGDEGPLGAGERGEGLCARPLTPTRVRHGGHLSDRGGRGARGLIMGTS